jgi:hypothetical protein
VLPNIEFTFSASPELFPTAAAFSCVSLLVPFYVLGLRMNTFRQELETDWRRYHAKFNVTKIAKNYVGDRQSDDRPQDQ